MLDYKKDYRYTKAIRALQQVIDVIDGTILCAKRAINGIFKRGMRLDVSIL